MPMVLVARQLQEKCREQHKDLFMVLLTWQKPLIRCLGQCCGRCWGRWAVLLGIWLCFDRCMMEQMHAWSIWVKSLSLSLWMRESGRVVCSLLFSSTYSWPPLRVLQLGMFEPRTAWLSLTDWMVACSTLECSGLGLLHNLSTYLTCNMLMMLWLWSPVTGEGLQRSLNSMARAYGRTGLRINSEKTEVLTDLQSPTITRKLLVDDRELKDVSSFRY